MKVLSIALVAALGLGLVSCGGKDKEEVKTISKASEMTSDQEKTALGWYMEAQEKQIAEIEEAIANVEEDLIEDAAALAGTKAYMKNQAGEESEAYKEVKDKVVANKQKIEQLQKDLDKAREDKAKELGLAD